MTSSFGSVLDLPELALECILDRLDPSGLLNMSWTCSSLRGKCRSDHLWEKHLMRKWGNVIGGADQRDWQGQVGGDCGSRVGSPERGKNKVEGRLFPGVVRLVSALLGLRFLPWVSGRGKGNSCFESTDESSTKVNVQTGDSVMCRFLALESGRFWFPAQVFNREHGHNGFMLSCYDAEVSYDRRTNTFKARFSLKGRRAVSMEIGVTWDRIRPAPVATSPYDLHPSGCLNDLRPGDHIEIQWRRNKEFPYGWWYGTVGHLQSCNRDENYCRCHESDTAVLEFIQYSLGSRWRLVIINRSNHREEGNEVDGFYGGIRKLDTLKEICVWKQFWPPELFD